MKTNNFCTPAGPHRTSQGFTLIEILVAVLLLSISLAAIVSLWSVSRKITERSRDGGEYYAVARQEVERDKASQFKILYITENRSGTVRITDYSETGAPLATNGINDLGIPVVAALTLTAAPTATAYYRAVSTYSLVSTGSDVVTTRRLGIQKVEVYRRSGTNFDTASPVYETTDFYSAAGV
jgi:prepilin-type N-terminal cleavage/methylation domain-containing protein